MANKGMESDVVLKETTLPAREDMDIEMIGGVTQEPPLIQVEHGNREEIHEE